jgi:hypothetical protein
VDRSRRRRRWRGRSNGRTAIAVEIPINLCDRGVRIRGSPRGCECHCGPGHGWLWRPIEVGGRLGERNLSSQRGHDRVDCRQADREQKPDVIYPHSTNQRRRGDPACGTRPGRGCQQRNGFARRELRPRDRRETAMPMICAGRPSVGLPGSNIWRPSSARSCPGRCESRDTTGVRAVAKAAPIRSTRASGSRPVCRGGGAWRRQRLTHLRGRAARAGGSVSVKPPAAVREVRSRLPHLTRFTSSAAGTRSRSEMIRSAAGGHLIASAGSSQRTPRAAAGSYSRDIW